MNNQFFPSGLLAIPSGEQARKELARRTRAARKQRLEIFGPKFSRELPWDILVFIYVSDERARLNVSAIYAEVGAPPTTVLRWLSLLEDAGFVIREPHPTDLRVVHVVLSEAGRSTMNAYFDAVLAMNTPGL